MSDDQAWKTLCEKHAYRRMSSDSIGSSLNNSTASVSQLLYSQHLRSASPSRMLDSMSAIDEDPEVVATPHDAIHTAGSRRQKKPRPNTTPR